MACYRIVIMRKKVEMMARSTTAKNGHERIVNDRDNAKHLEYFMNDNGNIVRIAKVLPIKSVHSKQ